MTYTALVGVGIALALVVDLAVFRTRLVTRKIFWTSWAIMVVFQLIVNGVLTGIPVVVYDPTAIIGWRLAYAPVEDLGFGFAMILLTLSTWVWLGRHGPVRDRRPAAVPAATRRPGG